jgi:hypothetical protein
MPATNSRIWARASLSGSAVRVAGGGAETAQIDANKAMSSHIRHRPSRLERWSRRDPAATGSVGEWLAIAGLVAALALGTTACGAAATYREVHLSEPVGAAGGRLDVEVRRVLLTDATIENGVGDGMGLVVELAVTNRDTIPYGLPPTGLWCLMQVDARHPAETRLLPPSVNGDGAFPGAPPEEADLKLIDVAPGQTRAFWVLFRGYRFDGSDVPRRITLALPDAEGHPFEVVLADPARGDLRWNLKPIHSTWTFGVQGANLYGSYVQAMAFSERISRVATAGRFLWDAGLVSTTLVQVEGRLRSQSSSFTGIGVDAHGSLPLWRWGDPASPVRLGPYLGGQIQTLLAIQPTPKQMPNSPPPSPPPAYGQGGPELGLEFDVGALRNAATPFPLSTVGDNPLPRWSLRVGYTHSWIGHGTADGYVTGFRLAW